MQKKMDEIKKLLDESCILAEKVVAGNVSKQQYVDQNKIIENKVKKLEQDVSNVVQTM